MSKFESCDNGNKTGCINCAVDPGYACTGAVGAISVCQTICGDMVKTDD